MRSSPASSARGCDRRPELLTLDDETAEQHYAEHDGKPFFGELVDFITSGPLVAMVLEGDDAVTAARQLIGATNPLEAAPGSIRGDFAIAVGQNMVHGSDSPESAAREIGCSSRTSSSPPQLILAQRSPQRRAILDSSASPSRSRAVDVEELDAGTRTRSRARTRSQGARRRRSTPRARRSWASTRSSHSTARSTASRPAEAGPRATLQTPRRADPRVVSGLALRDGEPSGRAEVTAVTFRRSTSALVDATSQTGEWSGRAGGYAIQGRGRRWFGASMGDYLNVVGLPVAANCSTST